MDGPPYMADMDFLVFESATDVTSFSLLSIAAAVDWANTVVSFVL